MKTRTGVAAASASTAGALLLIVAVAAGALNLYYRPTIEYAYSDGRLGNLSPSMTTLITRSVTTVVAAAGAALLWLGRRWRR